MIKFIVSDIYQLPTTGLFVKDFYVELNELRLCNYDSNGWTAQSRFLYFTNDKKPYKAFQAETFTCKINVSPTDNIFEMIKTNFIESKHFKGVISVS